MKKTIRAIGSLLACVAASFATWAVISYGVDSLTNQHVNSMNEKTYRIMCWLPDGQIFYNGHSPFVETYHSYVAFLSDNGPQTGLKVFTTNSCTWAKVN